MHRPVGVWAFLARHTSQLSVRAIEDISQAQQQDSDDVHHQSVRTLIDKTAIGKKESAASPDEHRKNGHRIGMNVQLGKQHRPPIAEWAHHMQVEPVFRFSRFQCLLNLFVHVPI